MERDDLIKNILLEHSEGLTVSELAERCDVSRMTMSKDLDRLVALNLIYRRDVGNAKLHYNLRHAKRFTKTTNAR